MSLKTEAVKDPDTRTLCGLYKADTGRCTVRHYL